MLRQSFYLLLLLSWGGIFSVHSFSAQSPSLIILNADVRTIDKSQPKAEAVAVTGNKISAVGSSAEIRRMAASETRIIDAQGKLVVPGFNDSHVHFFSIGARFFSLNLKDVKNEKDLTEQIKFHAQFLPHGQWLIGNLQTQGNSQQQILPTKKLIDEITPHHPVLLYLKGSEIIFANDFALKVAGIANKSDGILRGAEAVKVREKLPQISYSTDSLMAETATNYAASLGVTSVQDVHSDDSFTVYRQLEGQGKLKTRVYDCLGLREWEKLKLQKIRRADGDALIRRGCVKYFSDGDKEQIPELERMIIPADRADLQVMIHAIGQAANDVVLTIYADVLRQNGAKDRRFRIEHARNFRPEHLPRFIATKTIASMQPALFFDGNGQDSRLFRQMLDAKALLSFGSDANMIDLNPLFGIYAAVYGNNGSKGITVEEAVRAYTAGAAYAEFQENIKGTISVGKLADLVILSDNIFTIKPEQIAKVKVIQTIMDGRIVYQAE